MTPGEVIISIVDLSAGRPDRLSPAERERAARFHYETDRRRWTTARSALREILGDMLGVAPSAVPIDLTDIGKPVLAPPFDALHFNLSHCGYLMLVALCSDGAVGIDVEPSARAADLAGCEETFCHPDEIAALPQEDTPRTARLLEIWTAKEALLKAAGCGLLHPPQSVRIGFEPSGMSWGSDPALPGIDGWELRRVEDSALACHHAVVCVPPGAAVSRRARP